MSEKMDEIRLNELLSVFGKDRQREIIEILHRDQKRYHKEQLLLKTVFVVTERDNYGEQLFRGVFSNREKAVNFLSTEGLDESNIDEINEIDI